MRNKVFYEQPTVRERLAALIELLMLPNAIIGRLTKLREEPEPSQEVVSKLEAELQEARTAVTELAARLEIELPPPRPGYLSRGVFPGIKWMGSYRPRPDDPAVGIFLPETETRRASDPPPDVWGDFGEDFDPCADHTWCYHSRSGEPDVSDKCALIRVTLADLTEAMAREIGLE